MVRSASSSRHTGMTVWVRARARNSSSEGLITGSPASGRAVFRAEGPEEAGALPGVARARALLVDHEQQRVAVAVVVRAPRSHWTSPEVSPLRHTSWRLRLQNTVRPSARLRRRVSSFIHATISTWPVAASCTMAGARPAAS